MFDNLHEACGFIEQKKTAQNIKSMLTKGAKPSFLKLLHRKQEGAFL